METSLKPSQEMHKLLLLLQRDGGKQTDPWLHVVNVPALVGVYMPLGGCSSLISTEELHADN